MDQAPVSETERSLSPFAVLGMESKTLYTLGKWHITESHRQPYQT